MQSSEAESAPERLFLSLDGFAGPLDLLLDLARAQKVDLGQISILALVDQYLDMVGTATSLRLELAADWLVMAAWLTWLKSRLLVPADEAEAEEGEVAAEVLAQRLRRLEEIRAAASWMAARPMLGIDVFARGMPEDFTEIDRSRIRLDVAGLLGAYLTALRRSGGKRRYRPCPMNFWSVQDALARLQRLIGSLPAWSELERFLPPAAAPLARRAAYASTLIAGLELARSGRLALRQEGAFSPILIGPALPDQDEALR
jgi:segregation and condensation protein A